MNIAAWLLLCGTAAAFEPAPADLLARAGRGRVEFVRAVGEVVRFAPRLPSKERLYPYVLLLEDLEAAGRRYDLESLGVDPVKDLGAALTHEAGKFLRLDRDPPKYLDVFFKWSTNATRIRAADDSALLAAAAATPDELLAWNQGALGALERLRAARADAPALAAFGDLQGVVAREILRRRAEFPPARLLEAVDGTGTAQGVAEILTFLELETASAASPPDRARLLELALRAARAAGGLGRAAPLRLRASAGELLSAAVERALFSGDELDESLCRALVAELLPSQAERLLASLADLSSEKSAGPGRDRAVRALAGGIRGRFPHLASTRRRDFERIEARLASR